MSLSDLYHLKENEIEELYTTFAENFYTDDLYCALFKDDKKRSKFLNLFFKHYLKMLQPYCSFVADSKELHCIMVVFDSTLENKLYFLRALWLNIKMMFVVLRIFSWNGLVHVLSCWEMFTSKWVNDFVNNEYLHLDLIITKQEMRGKGLGSLMLQHMVEEAKKRKCDITMETHHKANLRLYEAYGFVVMSMIHHEQENLTQYNLLHRVERGN